MSEAEKARIAAQDRLEKALLRAHEVDEVVARMAHHDGLNNYTRLLLQSVTPEGRS